MKSAKWVGAAKWIGIGFLVSLILALIALAAAWLLFLGGTWQMQAMAAPAFADTSQISPYCSGPDYGMGPGMMRGRGQWQTGACGYGGSGIGAGGYAPGTCTGESNGTGCPAPGYIPSENAELETLTLDQAADVVEHYIEELGYKDLEIAEVMEFEYNYYAIVREQGSGIDAMELLIDKRTGAVAPEKGPNMMWNAKYGMHRRGRISDASGSGGNALSEDAALDIAQNWLDANRPGISVEAHAEPFYGYYTIHTLQDDRIEGMLSVHGATGQVWYHTWHGAFIDRLDAEEIHSELN